MDTVKSNAEAYIVCARTSTKPPKGRRRRNSQSRSSVPCVVEKKKCRRNESQISFVSKIPFWRGGEKRLFVVAEDESSPLCRYDDEEKNARCSEERLFFFFFFFPTSSLSPLSLLSLLSRVVRFSPSPSRSVPISKARHFPWTFPRTEEALDVVGDCDDAPPCVVVVVVVSSSSL